MTSGRPRSSARFVFGLICAALAAVVGVAVLVSGTAAEPVGAHERAELPFAFGRPSSSAARPLPSDVPRAARTSATHTSAAPRPTARPAARLVWSDEFDGPLGSTPRGQWTPQVGGSGWGNGQLECDTGSPDNSFLDGSGDLVITARYSPGYRCPDGAVDNFTSARLSTENLTTVTYGRIRIRAWLPSNSGLWPAAWLVGADQSTVGWPRSGEIDVAEVVGKTPDTIYQTVHGPTAQGGPWAVSSHYAIGIPTRAGFHTYGVDWTPDRIVFSVDGDDYVSYSRAQIERLGTWVFDKPFYLLLGLAVGGTFPGPPQGTAQFPERMLVDYVRVYSVDSRL